MPGAQNYEPEDDYIEDSDIINVESEAKSIDDSNEENGCRRRHKDRGQHFLADCFMAVVCGIGIGYLGMMAYDKLTPPEKPVAKETHGIKPSNGIILSDKGRKMLFDGFKEISRKHDGWYDGRVWSGLCEILGEEGEKIPDANVKKVLDDVLSLQTPMGRLLRKYRGPKKVPEPSQEDEKKFDEIYVEYERYQPIIDALFDENYDNETVREERNRGLYKIFHQ